MTEAKRGPFAAAKIGTPKVRCSDMHQPLDGAAIACATPSQEGIRVGVLIKGREYSVVLSAEGALVFAREIAEMSHRAAPFLEAAERLCIGGVSDS
jgi:hypothetical protein